MKKPFNPVSPEQPLADEQALLEHYRQHSHAQPTAAMDALILAAAAAELTRVKPSTLNWGQRLHAWVFGPGHQLRWSLALGSLASIGLGLTLSLRTVDQLPPAYDLGEPPSLNTAAQPAAAPIVAPLATAKMAESNAPKSAPPAERMTELKAAPNSLAPALYKPQAEAFSAPSSAPASPALEDKADSLMQEQTLAAPAQALGKLEASRELGKKTTAGAAQPSNLAADAPLADGSAPAEQDLHPAAPLAKAKRIESATFAQQLQALLELQRSGASTAATMELQRLQQLYPEHDVAAELAKLQAGAH
jgi:hypothetical protein